MADKDVKECPLSKVQVVASCDSSGITYVNDETPLNLEDGIVEISYINISEDAMVSEIELLDSATNDDDSSRQSFDNFEGESDSGDDTTDAADMNPDEEQIAITNDFLSGKISFQDFITRVEYSDNSQSTVEDSSDSDANDEEVLKSNENDPDYFPEITKSQPKNLFKLGKKRETSSLPKGNFSFASSSQSSCQQAASPFKKKKTSTRVMRRLPANLLGIYSIYQRGKWTKKC